MQFNFKQYYYEIFLSRLEEDMEISGSTLKYYEKRENGAYYPIVLKKMPFLKTTEGNWYCLSNRVYKDSDVLALEPQEEQIILTAEKTACNEDIFTKNNWAIDCRGRLLEYPESVATFSVTYKNNYYQTLFTGAIPKKNDIIQFGENRIKLGNIFSFSIDIQNRVMVINNNLIGSNGSN